MISVTDITKTFAGPSGTSLPVLNGVSLAVGSGSFCSILGPSGCGKTTLLRIVAGVERPDAGTVQVSSGGRPATVSFVHQQNDLLPWLTAEANIRIAIRDQGLDRKARKARSIQHLERVGLAGFDRHYPAQLSGGMQKRVSLARAMAAEAEVLLLDEPLAFLDFQTKNDLQQLIPDLHRGLQQTVLHVTHDIDEALRMSRKIVVLSAQPATIRTVVDVPEFEPRRGAASRQFQGLVQEIKEMLDDEDAKAQQRDREARLAGLA